MIYELRVYHVQPGRMPEILTRFDCQVLAIWARLGIRQIGFWTTLVGESINDLTYMLVWGSMAERESKWAAFLNDPERLQVRKDSERDGSIIASISNQLLSPTALSVLK